MACMVTFNTCLVSMNGAPDYISGGLSQRPFLGVKKIGAGRGGQASFYIYIGTPSAQKKTKRASLRFPLQVYES